MGACLPGLVVLVHTTKIAQQTILVGVGLLGAVAVLSTIAWGTALGAVGRWLWILASTVAGTGVLIAGYVFAVLATNDPDADIEAGAGVAILSIPTFVTVGALLALGGGIGSFLRRHRQRSQ